jgi:hypothetical protein
MGYIAVLSSAVAAVAACGAVYFAWLTVRDARLDRKIHRLERVGELLVMAREQFDRGAYADGQQTQKVLRFLLVGHDEALPYVKVAAERPLSGANLPEVGVDFDAARREVENALVQAIADATK